MIDWTADRIASLDTEGVMTLRQNADRLGVTPLVELCDADLARRSPAPKLVRGPRHDQVVVGFHFVSQEAQGDKERRRHDDVWDLGRGGLSR
jgi:hypothetical protein